MAPSLLPVWQAHREVPSEERHLQTTTNGVSRAVRRHAALAVLARLKRGATVQVAGTLTRYALDRVYGQTIARCTMTAEALRLLPGI